MARIPIYESQISRPVPNMPLRPYDTPNPMAGPAAALGAVGAVADKIKMKFQTEEDNRTVLNLKLKAMKDFGAFGESLNGRTDYANFEKDYDAFAEQWKSDNLGAVNERVFNEVMPAIGEMQIRGGMDTRKSARTTQQGVSLGQLDQQIAEMQQAYTFAKTDEDRARIMDLMNEAISMRVTDGVMDPLDAQKLWRGQQEAAADTDIARAFASDPQQLLKDLDDPEMYPWKTGAERIKLKMQVKDHIDQEARAARADNRADVTSRYQDEKAARIAGTTTGLTDAEIIRKLGPEDGAVMIKDMTDAVRVNDALKTIANMTPAEELDLLASFTPEGEGFADEQKNYDKVKAAIDAKHEDAQKANLAELKAKIEGEADARAEGKTTGVTDDFIIQTLGEEKGNELIDQMAKGTAFVDLLKKLPELDPQQEQDVYEDLEPGASDADFQLKKEQQKNYAEAQKIKRDALKKNPAQFVVDNNEAVRDLFAKAREKGATANDWQSAIAANLDAQAKLGVSVFDRKPLTDADAAFIVADWQAQADPKAQFESLWTYVGSIPDPIIQKQVFDQLVAADLPEGTRYALEVGRDPEKRNQAIQLMAELAHKTKPELPTGAKQKDVDTAITNTYDAGVGGALKYQYGITLNDRYLVRRDADRNALSNSAIRRMNADGATAESAFASSYADIFGSSQASGDTEIGKIIVPAGTDEDALENGMWRERQRIAEVVAFTRSPYGPNPTEEETRKAELWKEDYADRLRWINLSTVEGDFTYALVDTTTMQVVTDKDNKPFTLTIDTLTAPNPDDGGSYAPSHQFMIGPPGMLPINPQRRKTTP